MNSTRHILFLAGLGTVSAYGWWEVYQKADIKNEQELKYWAEILAYTGISLSSVGLFNRNFKLIGKELQSTNDWHKWLGYASLLFVALHFTLMPDSGEDHPAQLLGLTSLFAMGGIAVWSILSKIQYGKKKRIHDALALLLILGMVHGLWINSLMKNSVTLFSLTLTLILLGSVGYARSWIPLKKR